MFISLNQRAWSFIFITQLFFFPVFVKLFLSQACQKDWPLFKEMEHKVMYFKCHKCQGPLPVNIAQTVIPFFKCDRCGDQTNILGALKNLQVRRLNWLDGVRQLDTGDEMQLKNWRKIYKSISILEDIFYFYHRINFDSCYGYITICFIFLLW